MFETTGECPLHVLASLVKTVFRMPAITYFLLVCFIDANIDEYLRTPWLSQEENRKIFMFLESEWKAIAVTIHTSPEICQSWTPLI